MKNVVIGLILTFILIITIYSISGTQAKRDRKEEAENILSHSIESAIKECGINDLNNVSEEEVKAKVVYIMLSEINSDSDLDIKILNIDAEKGLLNVQATETFKASNGKKMTVSATKCAIIENYRTNEMGELYTINFIKNGKMEKSIKLTKGQKIILPLNISNKWYFSDGTEVTNDMIVGSDDFLNKCDSGIMILSAN